MNTANVDGISPMAHPLNMIAAILRSDESHRKLIKRDAFLANAPVSESNLFVVPKVIE